MAWSEHTTKAFDSDLQDLARTMAEMGGLAERQIAEAIEALTTRDSDRAWRVINADAMIDSLQRAIEERAVETIARRQPVAIDLRQVVGILRIANELERIGDLAKNIGKRIIAINGEDMPRRSLRGVSHMANLMLAQLRDVLDSFARRDDVKAVEVWTRDQDVDRLYTSLFRELLIHMMENPATVTYGIHLLFCTKNLERMGDHATNIAESVYYMVKGQTLLRERPKADITSMLGGAFAEALDVPAHLVPQRSPACFVASGHPLQPDEVAAPRGHFEAAAPIQHPLRESAHTLSEVSKDQGVVR
jgi:phosphate transport system protein